MPAPPAVAAGAKRLDAIRLRIFIENDVRFSQKLPKPGGELPIDCGKAVVFGVLIKAFRDGRGAYVDRSVVDVGLCEIVEALTDSLGSDFINSEPFSCVSVNQADTADTR